MAEKEKLDLGEEKPKSSKGIIFIVLGAVLATLVAVFATLYFMGIFPPKHPPAAEHGKEAEKDKHEEPVAEAKPVIYLPLTPAFVANFKSSPDARMVQIEMTVASTDQAVMDVITQHAPMLRNNLLLLLAGEDPAALKTGEGKEALRNKVKEVIKKIVVEQSDRKEGIDEVYFTGFVMQ